jgi:hypothetical protein
VLAEKHRGEHGHVLQLLPEHRAVLRVVRADPNHNRSADNNNGGADHYRSAVWQCLQRDICTPPGS